MLDSRRQRFAARIANACRSKLQELYHNPSSGAPICKVIMGEHECGRATESTDWPPPADESVVRTITMEHTSKARNAAKCWAPGKDSNIGAGVWIWWTDGLRSDNGPVGAAAVCKHGNHWRSRRSFLVTRGMMVSDTEMWAIRLAHDVAMERSETLQGHGVKMVAGVTDSKAAIRQAEHLELGPVQRLARRINRTAQNLLAQGITTEIYCVPGHSAIAGNEKGDRQANLARDGSGRTAIDRL